MHTDEAAFRITEGDILADLEGANAGTKVLRAAHCLEDRSRKELQRLSRLVVQKRKQRVCNCLTHFGKCEKHT